MRLCGRKEQNQSRSDPVLRKRGEKPAYGPKRTISLPPMMRESKCGTDMGGAPTAASPYTLALCSLAMSFFWHTKNCPEMGKAPKPFASGMPDFIKRGSV